MSYLLRRYRLPRDSEDLVSAWLWQQAPRGVELREEGERLLALAYFDAGGAAPPPLPPLVEALGEAEIEEKDWLAEWRARSRPIRVGRTLLVDPREAGEGEPLQLPRARHLLRLPARTAFGVGSHESTQLAWRLVESCDLAGKRLLDVGTGTGLLAFGARLRGARFTVGYDVDAAAALLAGQYARANGLTFSGFAGGAAALAPQARFDLIVANVVPHELRGDLRLLLGRLAPGGELICSGLLATEAAAWKRELAALGLVERARRRAGEWLGLRLARREEASI